MNTISLICLTFLLAVEIANVRLYINASTLTWLNAPAIQQHLNNGATNQQMHHGYGFEQRASNTVKALHKIMEKKIPKANGEVEFPKSENGKAAGVEKVSFRGPVAASQKNTPIKPSRLSFSE